VGEEAWLAAPRQERSIARVGPRTQNPFIPKERCIARNHGGRNAVLQAKRQRLWLEVSRVWILLALLAKSRALPEHVEGRTFWGTAVLARRVVFSRDCGNLAV
jgi:hypothetical protein